MRDPNRILRLLGKCATVWHEYPDTRLGQLLANLVHDTVEPTLRGPGSLFMLEDDVLEELLDAKLQEYGKYGEFMAMWHEIQAEGPTPP
jgi:hypothetical protein